MTRGRTARARAARRAVLLAAAAIGAVAPAAAAATPGENLGRSLNGGVVTDGHRTAAFHLDAETLRIVRDGATRDVALPPNCSPSTAYANGLGLSAAGGGQLLLVCMVQRPDAAPGQLAREPRLIDAATGVMHVPAGIAEWRTQPESPTVYHFDGVGAAGISAYAWDHGRPAMPVARDWRTGALLPQPGETPQDAGKVADLDRSDGVQRMCAPLARFGSEQGADWGFWPYQYEAPYGVGQQPAVGPIVVQRCGERTTTTIADDSPSLQIGRGHVVGASTERRFAYAFGCGVRLDWSVVDGGRTIGLLDDAVVLAELDAAAGGSRIVRVPLDGLCARAATAGRTVVASGGRDVTAAVRALSYADTPTGASARRLASLRVRAPQLTLGPAGRTRLTLGRTASTVRWRIGDSGRWRAAGESGRGWRIDLPRLGRERLLTVRTSAGDGEAATVAVRVRPGRR
ncbi:hypothetical protein VSS74_08295 [Conexibacter stalactiti]|uniref:Uncharacterized protein n=1 Tax=Conexibacter stalactiti TaxID=1940611 RepID=A0ABU4HM13_9ACTN|nr:hypothetical protein [Conexibacter stalactiti]MDW5594332.1 hypothetical protein [Conexibacter stalactiti]MEC5034974.1 hypothetical protein [Conexibacter stalactiti]